MAIDTRHDDVCFRLIFRVPGPDDIPLSIAIRHEDISALWSELFCSSMVSAAAIQIQGEEIGKTFTRLDRDGAHGLSDG
jgi:hypothetical protein